MSKAQKVFSLFIDTGKEEQRINCSGKEVFLHFANLAYNARCESFFQEKTEIKTEKKAIEALNNVRIVVETFEEKSTEVDIWVELHDNMITTLQPDEDDVIEFRAYEDLANCEYERFYTVMSELDEPEEEGENEALPTVLMPKSYFKCSACNKEEFLREGQVKCSGCAAVVSTLEKVYCEHCQSEFYLSDNIVNCPGCEKRIRSIEECLENTGVIPTEDPVKQKQIDTRRQTALLEERVETEKDIEDYETIVYGFNGAAIDAAWSILQTKHNNYVVRAKEECDTKEQQELLKAAKKVFKNIESIQTISEFVSEIEKSLLNSKNRLRNVNSSLDNFQLELNLEVKEPETHDDTYNSDDYEELPEEPEETEESEPAEIVNPEISEETSPEEMTFDFEAELEALKNQRKIIKNQIDDCRTQDIPPSGLHEKLSKINNRIDELEEKFTEVA